MRNQRGGSSQGSQRPPPEATTIQRLAHEISQLRKEQKRYFNRQEEIQATQLEAIPQVEPGMAHQTPGDIDGSASNGAIGWLQKFWAPVPSHHVKESPPEGAECPELKRQILALQTKLTNAAEDAATAKAAKEKAVRQLTAQANNTVNELQNVQQQWKESRAQNFELTRRLTTQGAKLESCQKALSRAGRKEDAAMDGDIQREFMALNNDIFQFVKSHIKLDQVKIDQKMDDGTAELFVRHIIAALLFNFFFTPEQLPMGSWDSPHDSLLRRFEAQLRNYGCDEKLLREWRVTTAKTTKFLPSDMDSSAHAAANWIWDALNLQMMVSHTELNTASRDLWQICEKAGSLAVSFSATSIEYSWEQTAALPGAPVDTSRQEIIGKQAQGGAVSNGGEEVVLFTVFGGVVRGDKRTGLLADGSTRLSATQVVVEAKP